MHPISRRSAAALLLSPLFVPAAMAAPKAAVKGPVPVPGFVPVWEGSAQGPYPVGNPSAQPDLRRAFPDEGAGAREQSLRMIVKPDIWGRQARVRLSNAFGTKPVDFDGVFVGLQESGAEVVPGTNRPVSFGGKPQVRVAPGQSVVSDPVELPFASDPAERLLAGRKL
ncbi:MAG: hypothetical protein P4L83_11620, partial [Nevskia sp.]|nr:hypothetical protein [Nevskia sp.]